MTIPTYEEDPDMYQHTGVYEVCVFCRNPTKFWHKRTNNPVCKSCAKDHKVSELHDWTKKTKSA